jgi:hypothetical protein
MKKPIIAIAAVVLIGPVFAQDNPALVCPYTVETDHSILLDYKVDVEWNRESFVGESALKRKAMGVLHKQCLMKYRGVEGCQSVSEDQLDKDIYHCFVESLESF